MLGNWLRGNALDWKLTWIRLTEEIIKQRTAISDDSAATLSQYSHCSLVTDALTSTAFANRMTANRR